MNLHGYRWILLEKLHMIDRELKHHFKVYYSYEILYKLLFVLVIFVILVTCFASILVHSLFNCILQSHVTSVTINFPLYILTSGFFGMITMFNVCLVYIIQRIRYVNLILKQLTFDSIFDDHYLFIELNNGFLSKEINQTEKTSDAYVAADKRKSINALSYANEIENQKGNNIRGKRTPTVNVSRPYNLKVNKNEKSEFSGSNIEFLMCKYKLADFPNVFGRM